MISPEKKDRVQKLKKAGYGIRWIARNLKISRNKVREILREAEPTAEETKARKKRPSLLDPYKPEIQSLLEKEKLLKEESSSQKDLTTTFILKRIRKSGYQGGRTILEDYLRKLRGPRRAAQKPFSRFETFPGEESQQDWSEYRVEIDGKWTKIQLFSLVLCWSRMQFFSAFYDQRLPSLLRGLVAAFKYFGGVSWRIVFDRQRTISPFEIAGKPVITEKFEEFKEHYGFKIFLCRPGHKERKGKVERPFDYFEKNFLPLRHFASLEDLNHQIRDWIDGVEDPREGNQRCHHTTREVPYERWLEEKEYLYELPQVDLLPRRVEKRLVNRDSTISVGTTLYTVPARLVERRLRQVWVSIGADDLIVYDKKGEEVARHKLSEKKGGVVIDETHYREIKRRRESVRRPELEGKFLEKFPKREDFLACLKETLRSIAPIHLREILALARRYRAEEVDRALERAVADNSPTAGYVRQILSRNHPTGHLGELHQKAPKGLSLGKISPGDSTGYQGIFETGEREQEQQEQEQEQERSTDDE
jgi:transposase